MKFIIAIFWELVENLPIILLFVTAVWLWAHQHRRNAVICCIVGGVSSALIIRFTEPFFSGYYEPWALTLVNVGIFTLLQVPFVAYLGTKTKWGTRVTDSLLGGITGVGIAIAQGIAGNIQWITVVLHALALGIVGTLLIGSIRHYAQYSLQKALIAALLFVVFMTLLIGLIDYHDLYAS
ncbi:MAG: hypothetical protein JXA21_15620 [Anaerolineae bacterium]|nr:hypothetical protein [Anaerolineae bacterium]